MAADGTTTVVDRRDGNQGPDEFSLIEYNFSPFFGLAVQMYEATLVSDVRAPRQRQDHRIEAPRDG